MKFNQTQIGDIIQMAWDDQTDFSHITKIYEINEGDVKKIMKNNYHLNKISFLLSEVSYSVRLKLLYVIVDLTLKKLVMLYK